MSADAIEIVIAGGVARVIYDDAICYLAAMGESVTTRASHVEPAGNEWTADMGPSAGPVLGPFATRKEALQAEVEWLKVNRDL